MKNTLIVLSSIALMDMGASAQTNAPLPSLPNQFDQAMTLIGKDISTATNWVVVGGAGHSLTGTGKNLLFTEGSLNFNQYIGLTFGYDYLTGNGLHQFNSVKGGVTLEYGLHPFGFLGVASLTNIYCTPFVFDQVATSSSSTVANIVGGGVDCEVYDFKNFAIHAGIIYEERTGDAVWDADYMAAYVALTRKF